MSIITSVPKPASLRHQRVCGISWATHRFSWSCASARIGVTSTRDAETVISAIFVASTIGLRLDINFIHTPGGSRYLLSKYTHRVTRLVNVRTRNAGSGHISPRDVSSHRVREHERHEK